MAESLPNPPHWPLDEARDLARVRGAGAVVEQLLARRAVAAFPEAWISQPTPDELRARARQIDALVASGASLELAGVPFAVKDNLDVAGIPTTAGCDQYSYIPRRSASSVQRLLDAGAIYAGKTNLDQFATGLVGTRSPQFGPCRNPIDPDFIAGGSSSGSAIVVATGEVCFALGSDTAGSGRVPAGLCGLVGVKPTPGAVPTDGLVPAMESYDCVTAFTVHVADARAVLGVLTGSARTAADRFPTPVRVGVPDLIDWCGDDDARACFDAALARLDALGCVITTIDATALRATGAMLYESALVAERHAAFGEFAAAHPDAMDPAVDQIVQQAGTVPGPEFARALTTLRRLRAEAEQSMLDVDVLATPTVGRVPTFAEAIADPFGPSRELGRLTAFVNPLGLAAVAVPSGVRRSGLPFGVSLVGRSGTDDALLALAAAFERGCTLPAPPASVGTCAIAVVGAHLSGQPLNHQLTDLGAVLRARTTTAPTYRLFALETTPPKPGLLRVPDGGGRVEVEVWELDRCGFGTFVDAIPAPLGVGKVLLADGSSVTGFLCEPHAVTSAREITEYGGWRAYLADHAGSNDRT